MRGATVTAGESVYQLSQFQSTLLMRGATIVFGRAALRLVISIHAPHARSDSSKGEIDMAITISIHAPHARSDFTVGSGGGDIAIFQSTLLMRGATRPRSRTSATPCYFNPRSSCEERRALSNRPRAPGQISIHAPHARSDTVPALPTALRSSYFNPRSSCEERRPWTVHGGDGSDISIHAPHARSDQHRQQIPRRPPHFNPRSSCEERQNGTENDGRVQQISIHAPHARSDYDGRLCCLGDVISIHAPHARSDRDHGERIGGAMDISIHAPHARSDRSIHPRHTAARRYFNPRSSCEERL